jgi:hypothetical protein
MQEQSNTIYKYARWQVEKTWDIIILGSTQRQRENKVDCNNELQGQKNAMTMIAPKEDWKGKRLICSIFVLGLHPDPPC